MRQMPELLVRLATQGAYVVIALCCCGLAPASSNLGGSDDGTAECNAIAASQTMHTQFDSMSFMQRALNVNRHTTDPQPEATSSPALGDGHKIVKPFQCWASQISPDLVALRDRMLQGPVHATPGATVLGQSPHYVFVIGAAYSGTTALYNLISTSPAASNLCSAKSKVQHCCEGQWQLINAHLMTYQNRTDPREPKNWNDAILVYEKLWNTSKTVLLDKSTSSIFKSGHIWRDMQQSGKKVSFIYLVRSPCIHHHKHAEGIDAHDALKGMVTQVHRLLATGARVLVVKYEDLFDDAYGTAQRLIQFLPELTSLDPAARGLSGDHCEPARTLPVAEYILNKAKISPTRQKITSEEGSWLNALGYTEEWLSTLHTVPTPLPVKQH